MLTVLESEADDHGWTEQTQDREDRKSSLGIPRRYTKLLDGQIP